MKLANDLVSKMIFLSVYILVEEASICISDKMVDFNESFLESVLSMYTACVFERAWFVDKLSPWCAAFTEDSLKVFEYEEDLHYYYHASYGQPMNAKIGCRPLQDMFQRFS